jgi:hypothetical protein
MMLYLMGDDVAVPALGQTNFLLSLFGWFFIFVFLCIDVGVSRFKVYDISQKAQFYAFCLRSSLKLLKTL